MILHLTLLQPDDNFGHRNWSLNKNQNYKASGYALLYLFLHLNMFIYMNIYFYVVCLNNI